MAFQVMNVDQRNERIENRKSSSESRFTHQDLPVFVPQKGVNKVRFVPPIEGDTSANTGFAHKVQICYLNGASYVNTDAFDSNLFDPIKDKFFSLDKSDPLRKKLVSRVKYIAYILDLNDENTLKVWAMSRTTMDFLIGMATDLNTGKKIVFEDPTKGITVLFKAENDTFLLNDTQSTTYLKCQDFQKGVVFPLDEAISKDMMRFDELILVPSVEATQVALDDFLSSYKEEVNQSTASPSSSDIYNQPPSTDEQAAIARVQSKLNTMG